MGKGEGEARQRASRGGKRAPRHALPSSGVSRSDGWLLNEHVLCPRRSTRVAEHRVEVPLTAPPSMSQVGDGSRNVARGGYERIEFSRARWVGGNYNSTVAGKAPPLHAPLAATTAAVCTF